MKENDTLAVLHWRLREVQFSLDDCARLISDMSLEPTRENIRRIGEAIGSISRIQQKIEALAPDLLPAFFKIGPEDSGTALQETIADALECERTKDLAGAAHRIETFLESHSECSDRHRGVAEGELRRITRIRSTQPAH